MIFGNNSNDSNSTKVALHFAFGVKKNGNIKNYNYDNNNTNENTLTMNGTCDKKLSKELNDTCLIFSNWFGERLLAVDAIATDPR